MASRRYLEDTLWRLRGRAVPVAGDVSRGGLIMDNKVPAGKSSDYTGWTWTVWRRGEQLAIFTKQEEAQQVANVP